MTKDKILHYLNAKSEYTANINLLNYTEQKVSIKFEDDGIIILKNGNKNKFKYNAFNKDDFDNAID